MHIKIVHKTFHSILAWNGTWKDPERTHYPHCYNCCYCNIPQLLPLPKLLQLLLLLQFVQPPEDMQVRKIILEQFAILNMPGEFIGVNSSSQTGLEKVVSNILVWSNQYILCITYYWSFSFCLYLVLFSTHLQFSEISGISQLRFYLPHTFK